MSDEELYTSLLIIGVFVLGMGVVYGWCCGVGWVGKICLEGLGWLGAASLPTHVGGRRRESTILYGESMTRDGL